jgi:hypothetical protein
MMKTELIAQQETVEGTKHKLVKDIGAWSTMPTTC